MCMLVSHSCLQKCPRPNPEKRPEMYHLTLKLTSCPLSIKTNVTGSAVFCFGLPLITCRPGKITNNILHINTLKNNSTH